MDAVGSRIPDFRAPASTGQTLEASSFVGSLPMVLMLMPEGVLNMVSLLLLPAER